MVLGADLLELVVDSVGPDWAFFRGEEVKPWVCEGYNGGVDVVDFHEL